MNQLTMDSINHFKRHCRLYSVEITLCSRISTFVVWQQLCLVFFSSYIIPKITLAHLIPFTELTGLNDNLAYNVPSSRPGCLCETSLSHICHICLTQGAHEYQPKSSKPIKMLGIRIRTALRHQLLSRFCRTYNSNAPIINPIPGQNPIEKSQIRNDKGSRGRVKGLLCTLHSEERPEESP